MKELNKILLLRDRAATDSNINYSYFKELIEIAAVTPEKLYNQIETIAELLESENKIVICTGMELIGYLSSVDTDNKIDNYINHIIKFLHIGPMIVSTHAIFALTLIAQNKSRFRKKIIKEFLQIENDKFKTEDYKNILIFKVLEAFKKLSPIIKYDGRVIDFIMRSKLNRKSSVKNKAEELLIQILCA